MIGKSVIPTVMDKFQAWLNFSKYLQKGHNEVEQVCGFSVLGCWLWKEYYVDWILASESALKKKMKLKTYNRIGATQVW